MLSRLRLRGPAGCRLSPPAVPFTVPAASLAAPALVVVTFPMAAEITTPAVALGWSEFPVAGARAVMMPLIVIVPVVVNLFCRVFSQTVRHILVVDFHPGSVVIRRRIPDIAPRLVVTSSMIVEIIRHADSDIKSELRRHYELRGGCDDNRWAEIDTHTDPHVGRFGL